MGGMINVYMLFGNLKAIDRLRDVGVGGSIILKWILGKKCGRVRTGCIWLRIGTNGGRFGTRKLNSNCTKWGEFLDI
jgi:hypothetical protein